MAPISSASTHPLAVYRCELGLSQPAMAKMLKVSVATVRAIEGGNMKLSQKLERRIYALRPTGSLSETTKLEAYAIDKVTEFRVKLYNDLGIIPIE